ncbi:PIN/TRAM domain-containing protein [Bacillus tianshenii]|nr:PIN/TRAM domain-containing protein [Bacillus tianshenii]
MLTRIVQVFFVIVGGMLGFIYIPDLMDLMKAGDIIWLASPYSGAVLGAFILYFGSLWWTEHVVGFIRKIEERLVKAPVTDLLFGSLGLIVGLILAFLIVIPFKDTGIQILDSLLPIFATFLLGYLGFQVGFKKRDELINLFSASGRLGSKKKQDDEEDQLSGAKVKILDTSVIIDGRIADICQTGFLEGTIVIPHFVLEELQHIADSSDVLKRNRGRRGLDILNKIRKELPVNVEIYEGDFEDIQEVDSKLVKLGKLLSGIVVTNDFNLNKVCELQNVAVLNINDLANAVKPVVLPGEELNVQVIKDGKEQNQGVAYLDDGTMIVVEEGRDYIGKRIDVLVTSVLQTSAGRMIFAKPKLLEKAL